MKVYEAVFNKEKHGMYALSLVENPAMQDEWIMLSEQPNEIQFAAIDEEKKLLLGAVLIPNKKILRKVDGNEFYITFSEDTIEKIAHDFFGNDKKNNSSLEHGIKLEGVKIVEAWTVANPTNDKSNNYGKTYPKGAMVVMMKVDDDIWKKAKNKEINGFSIDALLGMNEIRLSEIKLNTDIMENKDILKGIKDFLTKSKGVDKLNTEIEELKVELSTQKEKFESDQKDVIANGKKEFEALQKSNEDLKVEFSDYKEDNEKKIEKLKAELSKEPEDEPIKRKEEKTTKVFKIGENRKLSTQDRVYEKMFD